MKHLKYLALGFSCILGWIVAIGIIVFLPFTLGLAFTRQPMHTLIVLGTVGLLTLAYFWGKSIHENSI